MSFIFTIIGLMVSLDVIWWIVLARLTNHAIGRVLVSIFMLAMMFGLIAIIAARMYRGDWDRVIPKFAVSAIFIWHFIGLGLLSLIGLLNVLGVVALNWNAYWAIFLVILGLSFVPELVWKKYA